MPAEPGPTFKPRVYSTDALHMVYRDKPFETRRTLTVALVLIGLGILGTFPIFFQAFAPAG